MYPSCSHLLLQFLKLYLVLATFLPLWVLYCLCVLPSALTGGILVWFISLCLFLPFHFESAPSPSRLQHWPFFKGGTTMCISICNFSLKFPSHFSNCLLGPFYWLPRYYSWKKCQVGNKRSSLQPTFDAFKVVLGFGGLRCSFKRGLWDRWFLIVLLILLLWFYITT